MVYSLYSGFPYRKVYSPTLPPLGSWAQMAGNEAVKQQEVKVKPEEVNVKPEVNP